MYKLYIYIYVHIYVYIIFIRSGFKLSFISAVIHEGEHLSRVRNKKNFLWQENSMKLKGVIIISIVVCG